jgi:hypothetical protein
MKLYERFKSDIFHIHKEKDQLEKDLEEANNTIEEQNFTISQL